MTGTGFVVAAVGAPAFVASAAASAFAALDAADFFFFGMGFEAAREKGDIEER